MVVKMMRWRPWPPPISRKYEVKLTVHRLEGGDWLPEYVEKDDGGLAVEIRWKGPKISLGSFRRTVKRNCTREEVVKRVDDGPNQGILVEWDEEFHSVCSLSGYKDNVLHPWEINFTVLHGLSWGAKNSIVGSAALNLAEYPSKTENQVTEVKLPLTVSSIAFELCPSLCISIGLRECGRVQQPKGMVRCLTMPAILLSTSGETPMEKDEVSAIEAGFRKVKMLTNYVTTRRSRKAFLEDEGSEVRSSSKSEEDEYAYHSMDEFEEEESGEGKENSSLRKSFSYETLVDANYAGALCYSTASINAEDEGLIYYSNHHRSDVGNSHLDDTISTIAEQSMIRNSKLGILPWRKRKLSFRSPKAKGEPLLKKANGEEGGDDIDFDRRQLSSDELLSYRQHITDEASNANRSSVFVFGDDSFSVGTWEQKEITSRDGHMKMLTQVFFASIDQRSERAAGESACTALVAVIADWLQNNRSLMPIKSQFDSLIRDGSLEWRNLCENEFYREQFPDRHFDLETVLQSKIRDICVDPGKSFIGFFYPDGVEGGSFDFLHGAMSFDNIWNEISQPESSSNGEAPVFIVSWNDHFFVLKVETDVYYIIDTLGERLHEGCKQAYILKFDRNTTIYDLRSSCGRSLEKKSVDKQQAVAGAAEPQNCSLQASNLSGDSRDGTLVTQPEEPIKNNEEEVVVCQGKESCKEYIKNFLAAIPIRELQADIRKGLAESTPLLRRLQIEFHFTQLQWPTPRPPATVAPSVPQAIEAAVPGVAA